MRHAAIAVLITGILSPWPVHACSQPVATAFDTVAPTATDIVAVQVESLALEPDSLAPAGVGHMFHGKIRVLKHYRGSRQFTDLNYHNDHCAGLRINVGGIYLIATSAMTPTIELNPHAAPILHLSGFFTFDPNVVLRLSQTVKQLEAALRGDRTFAITTDSTRQDMSMLTDPPPVPPPLEVQE